MHFEDSKDLHKRPTDADLIESIHGRESDWRDLFGVLVKRHQGAVYARCMAYLRKTADADDALQETLFRAFRAIDGFKGDAAFRTWLFAIADNQCHLLARRRSRQQLDEQVKVLIASQQELRLDPGVSADECREVVHSALERIAAKGREVLHLRYFADLSIDDVAFTLGVGISAAKMRLYRAQEQLAGLTGERVMDRTA